MDANTKDLSHIAQQLIDSMASELDRYPNLSLHDWGVIHLTVVTTLATNLMVENPEFDLLKFIWETYEELPRLDSEELH